MFVFQIRPSILGCLRFDIWASFFYSIFFNRLSWSHDKITYLASRFGWTRVVFSVFLYIFLILSFYIWFYRNWILDFFFFLIFVGAYHILIWFFFLLYFYNVVNHLFFKLVIVFVSSSIDLFTVVPYFIYYIARLTAFIEQIRVNNQILKFFFFSLLWSH